MSSYMRDDEGIWKSLNENFDKLDQEDEAVLASIVRVLGKYNVSQPGTEKPGHTDHAELLDLVLKDLAGRGEDPDIPYPKIARIVGNYSKSPTSDNDNDPNQSELPLNASISKLNAQVDPNTIPDEDEEMPEVGSDKWDKLRHMAMDNEESDEELLDEEEPPELPANVPELDNKRMRFIKSETDRHAKELIDTGMDPEEAVNFAAKMAEERWSRQSANLGNSNRTRHWESVEFRSTMKQVSEEYVRKNRDIKHPDVRECIVSETKRRLQIDEMGAPMLGGIISAAPALMGDDADPEGDADTAVLNRTESERLQKIIHWVEENRPQDKEKESYGFFINAAHEFMRQVDDEHRVFLAPDEHESFGSNHIHQVKGEDVVDYKSLGNEIMRHLSNVDSPSSSDLPWLGQGRY